MRNLSRNAWILAAVLLGASALVNWMIFRDETAPERRPLADFPSVLGTWRQRGDEIKFDQGVESILRASDYTMREFASLDGSTANVYIGYYRSQRTGATYHSPQNCLPGAGWTMREPQTVTIQTADGSSFTADLYFIDSGIYHEVMVYWYEGRGRREASEYRDKINTVLDSFTRQRTDGAMVRVMTSVGNDPDAAKAKVIELSSLVADDTSAFIPK